ncbi:hypothetical protein JKP88DRAFT_301886 [Tribonema minus]|uniref:Uncharacterized protein n=1 Tax=Tribonema minus TaxID=303371 RepID=A0A835ZAH6_9STRA|nr:hypothetical protein JKP88DRAFT_301886 [Tribonema minus]
MSRCRGFSVAGATAAVFLVAVAYSKWPSRDAATTAPARALVPDFSVPHLASLGGPSLVPDFSTSDSSSESAARPEAFINCGNWQESYMTFHRRTLAGELPPRYLVSVAVEAGLADRLVGTISEFYLALLSGRAFQITNAGQSTPRMESAYDAPYVNWTRGDDDPAILTEHLLKAYKGERQYATSGAVDTAKYWSMFLVNQLKGNDFYATQDLREVPEGHADAETVFVSSNRGRVFQLFDNPYHKEQLYMMGLRPDTAFACAFHFLFRPNSAVEEAVKQEVERLSSTDDTVLKIAVQIRMGDSVFDPERDQKRAENTLKASEGFVECAKQIAASRRSPKTSKVLWYVASDSEFLRAHLLSEYGADTIVTNSAKSIHTDCSHIMAGTNCTDDALASALVSAAGTILAMSMTDYQVVTQKSGFGRVAAWLSLRWHSVYAIDPHDTSGEEHQCGTADYELLEASAARWSGI